MPLFPSLPSLPSPPSPFPSFRLLLSSSFYRSSDIGIGCIQLSCCPLHIFDFVHVCSIELDVELVLETWSKRLREHMGGCDMFIGAHVGLTAQKQAHTLSTYT